MTLTLTCHVVLNSPAGRSHSIDVPIEVKFLGAEVEKLVEKIDFIGESCWLDRAPRIVIENFFEIDLNLDVSTTMTCTRQTPDVVNVKSPLADVQTEVVIDLIFGLPSDEMRNKSLAFSDFPSTKSVSEAASTAVAVFSGVIVDVD